MAAVVQGVSSIAIPAEFDFENLVIERVIVHRVFERAADKSIVPPKLSSHLAKLPLEGVDALQRRITSAVGSRTHGVEMSIEKTAEVDFFQVAADLVHATDKQFIQASRELALRLAQAQGSTNAPGGILAIVRGRVGSGAKRFVAAVKADVHDGFGAEDVAQDVDVKYLSSLMLTPTQKLYKIGVLVEMNSGPRRDVGDYDSSQYRAFLFDHLITLTETRSAAAYFYSGFLGMGIQKSARKLTKDFYEHTTAFIASSSLSPEEKLDLKEALRVELRNSSALIDPVSFAKTNVPVALRKSYREFLDQRNFPKNSVFKDTDFVKAKLRRPRKMIFSSGVKVFVPSDGPANLVEVISHDGGDTTLVIKGSFTEET